MFTKKKLQELCEVMLGLAKGNLVNHPDNFAQTAVFLKGNKIEPVILDMSNPGTMHLLVQGKILADKPDAVVLINDAYMRHVEGAESEKLRKQLEDGTYPRDIHKRPDRIETLVITAGCIFGTACIVQPYHRENGKIVFDPRDPEIEKGGMFESAFFGDAWEKLAGKGAKH